MVFSAMQIFLSIFVVSSKDYSFLSPRRRANTDFLGMAGYQSFEVATSTSVNCFNDLQSYAVELDDGPDI